MCHQTRVRLHAVASGSRRKSTFVLQTPARLHFTGGALGVILHLRRQTPGARRGKTTRALFARRHIETRRVTSRARRVASALMDAELQNPCNGFQRRPSHFAFRPSNALTGGAAIPV
ncbi:hypothetical protein QQF64_018220 [Cirrhinus molitorella]|uniref:Uncharacterized protein n=1 Tax=Cirrhinus molitorella TaxID=172907 RepID=A0ABR3LPH4_9TELE